MADTHQVESMGAYIADGLGASVLSIEVLAGELILNVERGSIVKTMGYLRDDVNCQFKQLMDACGVDYPNREHRFDIVYNLLSLTQNARIRLKLQTDEVTPVPSVSSVYSSAACWEREAWDLYGIFFSEHPDLRRILTDYGFEGHPLRKDFPLEGETSEVPDVAFTKTAPMEGGPFVTIAGGKDTVAREPRRRNPKDWQN